MHIGLLKSLDKDAGRELTHSYKAPLFLSRGLSIDDLAVHLPTDLHATLMKFLSGEEFITIGEGGVRIQSYKYLKSIMEYRLRTDISMEYCHGMRRSNAVSRTLD